MHRESRERDRTQRLLKAAASDGQVEPVDAVDADKFDTLARVFDPQRPRADVWSDLTAREPQVGALEAAVRAGEYGFEKIPERPTGAQLKDPEWLRQRGEQAQAGLELMARRGEILGPQSGNADPVIRSRTAFQFAYWHLRQGQTETP
jgi:hypothetical protein